MTKVELAQKWFAYNPETGVVAWKRKPNRNIRIGTPAGCRSANGRNTYIRVMCEGQWVFAHVIGFALTYGRLPKGVIDHINGDGTDNRLANLREVSHAENLRNQRLSAANSSGTMGVDFHVASGKWRARIIVEQTERHLGVFDTEAAAVHARKLAEKKFGFHENHGRVS